ncbi:hypothetical protein KCU98_g54, partial [Aureobasidium melanogenum]
MALLYGYLFRVLCVLSILSSCFGNRVEGSHGIGKGIVEGARKPLEGGSVVSEHSAVDENKAVVIIWHHHHIVVHVGSRSRVIDRFEIGGHVGHGYRVETLHDCVLDARWPLGCRDGQSSPVKEGSASRNRLIEEVAGLLVVLQRVSLDLSEIWRWSTFSTDRVLVLSPEHQLCYVSDSDAAATAAPNTELSKAISIEMAPRLWPLRIASSSRLARKLRLNSIRRSQETTLKRPERVNSCSNQSSCTTRYKQRSGRRVALENSNCPISMASIKMRRTNSPRYLPLTLYSKGWKSGRSCVALRYWSHLEAGSTSLPNILSSVLTSTSLADACQLSGRLPYFSCASADTGRVHKELIQVLALDAVSSTEALAHSKNGATLTSLSEPSTSSILAAIQSKNALPFKSRIVFSAKMYDRLAKRNERTAACICLRLVVLLRGCRGASKRLSTSCKSLSMLLVRELCVSMPKASLLGDGNCKGWINEASMAVRRTRDVSVGFGK